MVKLSLLLTKPLSTNIFKIVATVLLCGFVGINVIGRMHQYYPLVSKQDYSSNSIGTLVESYFEGSFSDVVSFMVQQQKLSVKELELLLNEIKKSKK